MDVLLLQNSKLKQEKEAYRIAAKNVRNEAIQLRAHCARLLETYKSNSAPSGLADEPAVDPSPTATLQAKPACSAEGASSGTASLRYVGCGLEW
jgi:hypothetical protein